MKRLPVTLCALSVLLGAPLNAQQIPRFAEELHVFAVQDESDPPPTCATLFVGSSSFRFWFGIHRAFAFPVVNRGFGGATIADINTNFNRVAGRLHPRRIVFYAGENDLNAGRSTADSFSDFKDFLALKDKALGTTPVYFVSAKPSPSRWAQVTAQRELNAMVKALADERADLAYIDVTAPMLKQGTPREELYISDRLHMNSKGYALWKAAITRALTTERTTRAPGCK